MKIRLGRQEESLSVQATILTIARAVSVVFAVAVPLILVRVFVPSDFGVYKQVFLVAGTLVGFLDLGVYGSLFYFVPRDSGDGHRWLVQALMVRMIGGLAAGIGLVFFIGPLAGFMGEPELVGYGPLLALYVVLSLLSNIALLIPVIDRRPLLGGAVMTGTQLANSLLLTGAALIFRSVHAVVWAGIASETTRLLVLVAVARSRRIPGSPGPSWADLRQQLGYGLPLAAAAVFQIALERAHHYFVAAGVPSDIYAIYAVGVLQVPLVGLLVDSAVEVMSVRVASAHAAGDMETIRSVWERINARLAFIIVPAFVLGQILAADAIGLLFGDIYLPAVPVFRVFLMSFLLMMLVDHGVLRATGDTPFLAKADATGLGTTLLILWVFRDHDPMMVGISAFVAGLAAARAAGLARVSIRIGIGGRRLMAWRALGGAILSSLLASVPVFAVLTFFDERWLRLGLGGLVFGVTFAGIVLRFGLVSRDEVAELIRRLRPGSSS